MLYTVVGIPGAQDGRRHDFETEQNATVVAVPCAPTGILSAADYTEGFGGFETVSDATAAERWEVYYSGRVQGVGFRFTVQSLARGFHVTGFVRNLRDRRVELVAEGPSGEIRALLEAVAERMRYYIAEVQENAAPATGEFDGFGVRY